MENMQMFEGMGRYKKLEMELSNLSIDELNELYLTGELDEIYDEYDRTGEVYLRKNRIKKQSKKARKEFVM